MKLRLVIQEIALTMPQTSLDIQGKVTPTERHFMQDIADTLPYINTASAKPFIKSKLDIMSRAIKCPSLSILLGHNHAFFYKNINGHIVSQTPIASIAL